MTLKQKIRQRNIRTEQPPNDGEALVADSTKKPGQKYAPVARLGEYEIVFIAAAEEVAF